MPFSPRKWKPEPSLEQKKRKKKIIIGVSVIVGFIALILLGSAIKTGVVLNRVSHGNANIFESLIKSLPGADNTLEGETEGRVNILLLGMRGENVVGGGLLADTIMVLSLHPKNGENDAAKASLISIPRDLYVTVPAGNQKRKINAVYALGEERDHGGGGIADMKKVVSEVAGLPIHYGAAINFQGFRDLVNAIGGIDVHLDQPFEEGMQFRGLEQRCDDVRFTIPSGNYEEKRIQRKNGTYYKNPKRYPLCFERMTAETEKDLECGGDFKLPAGHNHLDGENALCYARARFTSSDFERSRRQQQVIRLIQEKALSIGTLADFIKVNAILESLGKNVSTDMAAWEMKRLFDLYQSTGQVPIFQAVLDTSPEGLLYNPPETPDTGYILLPVGDNYGKIHELFRNSLNH